MGSEKEAVKRNTKARRKEYKNKIVDTTAGNNTKKKKRT